jgi:hypothetical protein
MGNDQTRITGHVEIIGLGCSGERLTGKTVTVYTVDGNIFSGDVIEANHIVIYITETEDRIRMIKTSAIASILMSKEDAEQLMAKEKTVLSFPTSIPKRPISVHGDQPRF